MKCTEPQRPKPDRTTHLVFHNCTSKAKSVELAAIRLTWANKFLPRHDTSAHRRCWRRDLCWGVRPTTDRDENAAQSAAALLECNRDLQGSRAIRLLAATNLSLYATLMERHLSDGAVPETELVIKFERDLEGLDDPQSGLALIKSWAAQGWLHRIVDERHDQNVCYLTQDARRALDFLRGMRRQDTIATGGALTRLARRLTQVPVTVDNDPPPIRKHIEAEVAARHVELDALD